MKDYNTITYSWEPNPNGKYAYGATCVRDCPKHLLKDSGACVRSCPSNKKALNGECVPCVGPCPKTCKGEDSIHSGNIMTFEGCTVIEGSLTLLDHSFSGFQHVYRNFTFGAKYPEMRPSKLEVFSTLKEVTGYISIQASDPEFTNLSFLRNLEVIGGRETTEYFSSLYIVKTSLKSLGLRSLKRIRSGSVYILENSNLCFGDSIEWRELIKGDDPKSQLLMQNNRKSESCKDDGFVCNKECSEDGCWDVGEDQCLSCRNFKLGERCVNNCSLPEIYEMNSKECAYCHEECEGGCHGRDSSHCVRCRNVRDGPFCVAECPSTKFDANGECQNCHDNCVDGCTGPENHVGENGCNSCKKALVNDQNQVEYCLRSDEACPNGYFSEWVVRQETGLLRNMAGNTVCRKCHQKCKNCTAYGTHISVCHECAHYRKQENCEEKCPSDHYADEERHMCYKCSSECSDGCYGPLVSDCKACRNYRIYVKGKPSVNNTNFNCTAFCPPEYPYKLFPKEEHSDPYCAEDQLPLALNDESVPAIVGGTLGCLCVIGMFFSVFCYLWWQRNKTKEAALKMTMTMMPYDDNEPLKPTNIKPNLSKLRIVKEAELRKG
ncbi:UNVERIFIED_CONTAM: hypothetical protein GTU68_019816, partial [Idotea baltica]|nr:hypothetical protein [Idotea baltica]